MTCPKCESIQHKCINSRPHDRKNAIMRRRECLDCGHRWTTYEIMQEEAVKAEEGHTVIVCGHFHSNETAKQLMDKIAAVIEQKTDG